MFKIKAILGMKVVQGQVIRNEKSTGVILTTPHGLIGWLEEQQPFVTLEILEDGENVTADYSSGIQFVPSRFNQPIPVYDVRRI
jgi:hypothetical protein